MIAKRFFGHTESRQTVVIIPGMGMRPNRYEALAQQLSADTGMNCTILDYCSEQEQSRSSAATSADIARELNRAIETDCNFDRSHSVILIGHSLGGRIALLMAAERPSYRLSGVVTLASSIPYWRRYPDRRIRHLLRTQAMYILARCVGYYPGKVVGFGGDQPTKIVHELAEMTRTSRFYPSELGRVAVPVLSIGFDDDVLAPPGTVNLLHERLPRVLATCLHVPAAVSPPSRAAHNRWLEADSPLPSVITSWMEREADNPVPDALRASGLALANVTLANELPDQGQPLSPAVLNEVARIVREAGQQINGL